MKLTNYFSSTVKIAATAGFTVTTLAFAASEAQALTVLYGNYDSGTDYTGVLGYQENQITTSDNDALTFFTPNDGITRTLGRIDLLMRDSNSNPDPENLTVKFLEGVTLSGDGTAGAPETASKSFTIFSQDIDPESSNVLISIVPTTTVTLNPNTGYGFQLDTTTSFSGLQWVSVGDGQSSFSGNSTAINTTSFWRSTSGNPFSEQTAERIFNVYIQDPVAVPFEFSPSVGLLALGGMWGAGYLRKQLKSKGTKASTSDVTE